MRRCERMGFSLRFRRFRHRSRMRTGEPRGIIPSMPFSSKCEMTKNFDYNLRNRRSGTLNVEVETAGAGIYPGHDSGIAM